MKKAVWITGANSGIGKSITYQFSSNNICCIASARREKALIKMKEEAIKVSNNIETFPLDVSNTNEISKVSKKILREFDVDCLINNAGVTTFTTAENHSHKDVSEIIQTNLIGAIGTITSLLPHFKKRGGGIIINVLSVAAKKTFQNSSVYSASKAGLLAYSNVLREEVRQYNIKVINVLPGATRTPIWSSEMLNEYASQMMSPEDVAKFIYQLYSIDYNLVPEEIILRPIKGDL
ncbi:MAG: SDR family NAD(P)-dependent oxidoreductase [Melioribacteraceae bacterium]|nr:SDR family NAD(P)-dependent oxidoreductase [Melioribacteraceae bacterium]